MRSPDVSSAFVVALFGIGGVVLGFCSLGSIEMIFYTTKPFAFLDSSHLRLFVGLLLVPVVPCAIVWSVRFLRAESHEART